jgi:hypothetical protein
LLTSKFNVKFKGREPLLEVKAEVRLAKLSGFKEDNPPAPDILIPANDNPEMELKSYLHWVN